MAAEQFRGVVLGEDARDLLDRVLPGTFDEAVANADLYCQVKLPAAAWSSVGPDDARVIDQPILNVIGTEALPRFDQSAGDRAVVVPHAVRLELSGAGHLLMARS